MLLFGSSLLLLILLAVVSGVILTDASLHPTQLLLLALLFGVANLARRLASSSERSSLISFARFTHRVISPVLNVLLAYLAFVAVDEAQGPARTYLVAWLITWLFIVTVSELSNESKVTSIDLFLPDDPRRKSLRTGQGGRWKLMFSKLDWHTVVLVVAVVNLQAGLIVGALALLGFFPIYLQVRQALPKIVRALSGKDHEAIAAFIQAYQPEVLIYCSGASGSAYQLNQWTTVLERCEKRVLVLIRELDFLNGLNSTSLPIAYMRSISSCELFVTPQTKLVLYPANGQKNSQMFRMTALVHVFINHGESDKIVNVSKFLRCYDRLYVAGQMAMDRTQESLGIPDERFAMIGRPQTDLSLSVVTSNPSANERWTVLYAPTWEGFMDEANYTSVSLATLSAFAPILNDSKYRILFKSHPYTGMVKPKVRSALGQFDKVFRNANNVEIFDSTKNIHELMNESDILLTDVSSVLNDYLYTEKPILLTNPRELPVEEYHRSFPSSEAAYLVRHDMSDFADRLASIREDDVLRAKRYEIKEYSLGSWPQGAMRRFIEQLNADCLPTAGEAASRKSV